MKDKKLPQRKCVGCGVMKAKMELIKIVCTKQSEVSVDVKGKAPGRGAYVCSDASCLEKAKKGRKLERAFSTAVPMEIYQEIEEMLRNDASDGK